jgi:hypothetical protein
LYGKWKIKADVIFYKQLRIFKERMYVLRTTLPLLMRLKVPLMWLRITGHLNFGISSFGMKINSSR